MCVSYIFRRLKTEEKAKVVVANWEIEFIQFFAALAILHQDDFSAAAVRSPKQQRRPLSVQ